MANGFVGQIPRVWFDFELMPGKVIIRSDGSYYAAAAAKPERVLAALADPDSPPLLLGQQSPFDTMWLYKGLVLTLPYALKAEYPSRKEYSAAVNALIRAEVDPHLGDLRKAVELAKAQLAAPSPDVAARERISDEVKVFVWQRDQGRCVTCASNVSLEFDHIIPVTMGGSNTARNIQLLCEPCNRAKGASITVR